MPFGDSGKCVFFKVRDARSRTPRRAAEREMSDEDVESRSTASGSPAPAATVPSRPVPPDVRRHVPGGRRHPAALERVHHGARVLRPAPFVPPYAPAAVADAFESVFGMTFMAANILGWRCRAATRSPASRASCASPRLCWPRPFCSPLRRARRRAGNERRRDGGRDPAHAVVPGRPDRAGAGRLVRGRQLPAPEVQPGAHGGQAAAGVAAPRRRWRRRRRRGAAETTTKPKKGILIRKA